VLQSELHLKELRFVFRVHPAFPFASHCETVSKHCCVGFRDITSEGTVPESRLPDKTKFLNWFMPPNSEGIVPDRRVQSSKTAVAAVQRPSSDGSVPEMAVMAATR
jgi:hypothetical protein